MNSQKKHFNFKNDSGSVTLFVLIAMIFFLIVCFFIYTNSNNKKVSQMKELEQVKKNYESTAEEIESKYESITGDTATNVDLTNFVTGEDVSHTHVYEKNMMIQVIGKSALFVGILRINRNIIRQQLEQEVVELI